MSNIYECFFRNVLVMTDDGDVSKCRWWEVKLSLMCIMQLPN